MLERLLTLEKTDPVLHKKLSADPRETIASHPKKSRMKVAPVGGSQEARNSAAAKLVYEDLEEPDNNDLEPPFNEDNNVDDENIPTSTIITQPSILSRMAFLQLLPMKRSGWMI
jgi:hypothetical protein